MSRSKRGCAGMLDRGKVAVTTTRCVAQLEREVDALKLVLGEFVQAAPHISTTYYSTAFVGDFASNVEKACAEAEKIRRGHESASV